MGLAGRKTKQRIGVDPRNLTWSNGMYKSRLRFYLSALISFVFLRLRLSEVRCKVSTESGMDEWNRFGCIWGGTY